MATAASTIESSAFGHDPNGQLAPAQAGGVYASICGYPVDSVLSKNADSGEQTLLAIGAGGRGIVLKALDEDCLLKASKNSRGGLHPSIRERLSRVRELAHTGVANLHGIERDAGRAWIIWEYVPGLSFEQYAATPGRTSRELAIAAREMVLAVETLHAQGIVHGAIKPGNVIVTPAGAIRLTHISPYLYTDPDEDARAVFAVLEESIVARHEERSPLAKLVMSAHGASGDAAPSLRRLGAKLAAMLSFQDESESPATRRPVPSQSAGPRRTSLASAAVVTLLGAAAAYGAWHAAGSPPLQLPRSTQVNGEGPR